MSVRAPHITCSPVRRPVMMSGRDRDAGASVRVDFIDQLLRGASICESSASGGRAADLRAATTFAGSLSTTADSCIALIILVVKEWRQLGTRRRRGWDGMCRFCITLNTRVLHASKRSKTTLLPTYKCTVRTSGLRTLATIVSTMHHAPEAQEGHTPRPRCQHNRA